MAPVPIPAFADNYIWRLPAQSGRGTLLGKWVVHPAFLVAFVALFVGVYALRDDYYPIHE